MTKVMWEKKISSFLVGKTIKTTRYFNDKEMGLFGWDDEYNKRPLVIFFNDGSWIVPMMDDEGNDGGALAVSDEKLITIPVM